MHITQINIQQNTHSNYNVELEENEGTLIISIRDSQLNHRLNKNITTCLGIRSYDIIILLKLN